MRDGINDPNLDPTRDRLAGSERLADREVTDRELTDRTAAEERITLNEEQLAIGKRQQQAGEVEVQKHVETRHVSEQVPLTRDEVTVERRPLTGADAMHAAPDAFREESISVPLTREEVVAEKRAVGAEEIVLHKHQVQENQTVEADLRRERAEVREVGDVHRTDGLRADATTTDRDLVDRDNPLRGGRDLDGDGVR